MNTVKHMINKNDMRTKLWRWLESHGACHIYNGIL